MLNHFILYAAIITFLGVGFHQGDIPLKEVVYFDVAGATKTSGQVICHQKPLKQKGNEFELVWLNNKPLAVLDCKLDLSIQIGGCIEPIKSEFSMLNEMHSNYFGKCKKVLNLQCYRGINYTTKMVETECTLAIGNKK